MPFTLCANHKCGILECHHPRRNEALGLPPALRARFGSIYCDTHACRYASCQGLAYEDAVYCQEHLRCRESGCDGRVCISGKDKTRCSDHQQHREHETSRERGWERGRSGSRQRRRRSERDRGREDDRQHECDRFRYRSRSRSLEREVPPVRIRPRGAFVPEEVDFPEWDAMRAEEWIPPNYVAPTARPRRRQRWLRYDRPAFYY